MSIFLRGARQFSSAASKNALIIGGNGALGRSVTSEFNSKGWNTHSVDIIKNPEAGSNVVMDPALSWKDAAKDVLARTKGQKFDSVVCVAGGWGGDTAGDESLFDTYDLNMDLNLRTAVTAAYLASKALQPGGLLVLTGSAPVYEGGTGFMLSYGLSKAGVHNMVQSLASPSGGLPEGSKTLCLLPATIDTPGNRSGMPDADFGEWTRPSVISSCIVHWSDEGTIGANLPPAAENGAFYHFKTVKKGVSITDYVNDVEVAHRQTA